MKGRDLEAVLLRKPLSYRIKRQKGSHRVMESEAGYPKILFTVHDGATVGPKYVERVLCKQVGLSEEDALAVLR